MNKATYTHDGIELHPAADFEGMRRAGKLAAQTLDMITEHVVPGVTTEELDRLCHMFITKNGAIPAPLNYKGFPKSICTSIDKVVCHGIPTTKKQLIEGEIINIDVTVILDGWYGDTSRTYLVGNAIKPSTRRIVDITYECLMRGIEAAKPGNTLGDVGHVIQSLAESKGYSVVRDFCGHGIGRNFHEAPSVVHYGRPGKGVLLEPGMFFTIEPMINEGSYHVKIKSDGWTAVTADGKLSAQFEHTIGITEDGCEIFTLSPAGYTKPPYK